MVVAVYLLSSNLRMAVEYAKLLRRGRKRQVRDLLGDDVPPVRDWFLEMPLVNLDFVYAPQTEMEKAMLAKAVRFVASKKVVDWVCQRNYKEGHAPTAFELVRQYEVEQSNLVSDPTAVQHFPLGPSRVGRGPCVGRAGRKWIESLKQNFRLKRKILPTSEALPLEEVKAKVRLGVRFWGRCPNRAACKSE